MDEHAPEAARPPERGAEPAGDVVGRLAADVATLAGLYGAEIREHYQGLARDALRATFFIGAALALGFFALGLLAATLVLVAAIWLPGWLASLLVLGALVLVMVILVTVGMRRVRRRRAAWAARVEEEVRWLKSLFPRQN